MIEKHYLAPIIREFLYYCINNRFLAEYVYPEQINLLRSSTPMRQSCCYEWEVGIKCLQFKACEDLRLQIKDSQASRDYIFIEASSEAVKVDVFTPDTDEATLIATTINQERLHKTIAELKRRCVISKDFQTTTDVIIREFHKVLDYGRNHSPMPPIVEKSEIFVVWADADCGYEYICDRRVPKVLLKLPEGTRIEEFIKCPFLQINLHVPSQCAEEFWAQITNISVNGIEVYRGDRKHGKLSNSSGILRELDAGTL